jgi:hypothetical protein
LIARVEVPVPPEMLDALSSEEGPAGETVLVRATLFVNPLDGVIVIVEVPALPAWIVREVGLAVTVKLGVPGAVTVTWTVFEWTMPSPVPVIVTA